MVVVTGAAQGIGRACALRMAAEGARVVLVDRAAGPCEAVRDQITAAGGEGLLVAADLEQHEGAQAVLVLGVTAQQVQCLHVLQAAPADAAFSHALAQAQGSALDTTAER